MLTEKIELWSILSYEHIKSQRQRQIESIVYMATLENRSLRPFPSVRGASQSIPMVILMLPLALTLGVFIPLDIGGSGHILSYFYRDTYPLSK